MCVGYANLQRLHDENRPDDEILREELNLVQPKDPMGVQSKIRIDGVGIGD